MNNSYNYNYNQNRPKAHGRSKVSYDQGLYIAEGMRYYIQQGFINSLEDQKLYFLQLAQDFISNGGDGKVLKDIADTTLYDFLRKNHIAPYSKAQKNAKKSSNSGFQVQYNSQWETQCTQSETEYAEDSTFEGQHYNYQQADFQENQYSQQEYPQQSFDNSQGCEGYQQEYSGQEQTFCNSWGESYGNDYQVEQEYFPQQIDENKNYGFFNEECHFSEY